MHDVSDPRNASILINVNGELKPRAEAVVSVFDSGFMLGDGVWEGLRVHQRQGSPSSTGISTGCSKAPRRSRWISASSRSDLTQRLYDTLDANGMRRACMSA